MTHKLTLLLVLLFGLCLVSYRQHRKVPDSLKALVSRCWDADYDARPEMTEVIAELQKTLQQMPLDTSLAAGHSQCCVLQ